MSSSAVFPFALTIPTFYPLSNSSIISTITPTTLSPPFYYTSSPNVLSWVSDKYLNLAAPIVAYWVVSLFFHYLDHAKIPYFEARRIHESPEVLARNKCSVGEVVRAVLVQQFIQVLLGSAVLHDELPLTDREHLGKMARISPRVADVTLLLLGRRSGEMLLKNHGTSLVEWTYWWGIPIFQFLVAFFVMDCWQYFLHRSFHASTFLYRHIHSVHHKLYVPYAFGALYNHPLEGFLFDSLGAVVSETVAGLTLRQATLLFAFSSSKTVDDHCGYKIWWDPCQLFFYNNADYHDIHHQLYGLKANYSQPFFTNWDILLGTRMTREEATAKSLKAKSRKAE